MIESGITYDDSNLLIKYFAEELVPKVIEQLENDDARWGETWRHRDAEHQAERIMEDYRNYFDQYKHGGQQMPWLKVIGNAVIAQARIDHPEWLEMEG